MREGSWSRLVPSLLAAVLLGLLATQRLHAQVDTGAILGTVKDQSGAVVPGAKVTVTNEGTSSALSKETGSDGTYVFTPLRIGTYTVSAEFQGFQKAERAHVAVDVQQQAVVDFALVPGAVTQTVEVTSEVPLLQTTNASVGEVVNSRAVNNLPLNGRNYTFLAQLTAGVNTGQEEGRGLNASGSFTANGSRPAQNNYLLDGIDNNIDVVDFLNGNAFVVKPSVDAIQEFKIQTSNYSAEIGRAGGAVLNATIKSGTNQIHGDVWEFLRNDALDARDFFEPNRGEFRQNQFGGTIGGPVVIPHVYDGRNKTFWFFDYEETRVRQATPYTTTVPTAAERASGYQNFADLITGLAANSPNTDVLGRSFGQGTIFDPATTRPVTAGIVDPVTGKTAKSTGFVRDPFAGNILPLSRIDPNAVKLLNLFPAPNAGGAGAITNNYLVDPVKKDDTRTFDVRVDQNFSDKDTMFARYSYDNEPQFKPGPFGGIADGGGFNQGVQTAISVGGAISETHAFSPSLVNEARIGFTGIHTGRLQPHGSDLSNLPLQFGVQGIPQVPENGGLPAFGIGNYSTLGSNAFLVSDEFNSTTQLTENLTKIYHSHSFKGGVEFQHIKFSTLQPPWSRGQFNFNGNYTQIPNKGDGSTGVAQLLLTPTVAPLLSPGASGVDNVVGGANASFASNISNTDNGRNYYGGYFQDDWKVSPKLTLNLGVRWDHFGQVEENFGAQANFIPGAPGSSAQYLIPIERQKTPLSPSFTSLLAKDGIALVYSKNFGLGNSSSKNFSPRVGFAYQLTPKLVARGGYGIFYGGFENRGYSPNLGENYPFQFNFAFFNPNDQNPIVYTNTNGTTCGTATLESGFSCIPLDPTVVNASGLSLRGIQYNYITPYTQGYNFTFEYQVSNNDALSLGYVGSKGTHLETFTGNNNVNTITPPGTDVQPSDPTKPAYVPFRDFGRGNSQATTNGNSYYHSMQFKWTHKFAQGLDFLGTYTWSKARTDAFDLLNGGGDNVGFRAIGVPGYDIRRDYSLANFDVRNVVHFSGFYQLPFGKGQHFAGDSSGIENAIIGGWSMNYILTLTSGQPLTVPCHNAGASNLGCVALLLPGQKRRLGNVNQFYNPLAFADPAPATTIGQTDFGPLGGAPSQLEGPGFGRFDWSLFKKIQTSEQTHLEFRAEFFNLTNHPNFSQGTNLNFTDKANFGKITSTRDAPNDPRQIQFALKFYW